MLTKILLFTLIGILFGIITGLVPGIHINMVATFLLTSYTFLSKYFQDTELTALIVAMSITHTFLDFIPSTFLGAPSADTVLSLLPSHKYLMKGEGYKAVKISIIGSLIGLIAIIITSPLLIFIIPPIYEVIKKHVGIILIFCSMFLIFKDKKKRLLSLLIFLLSGILGAYVLNINVKQPLLPLFTGLFGISSLILSIFTETKIPEQIITEPEFKAKKLLTTTLLAIVSSTLTGFLPGLGSSQAAIISTSTTKLNKKYYIFLIGGINIIVMIISFLALYTIQKSRNGIGIAIQGILENVSLTFILFFFCIALITSGLAYYLGIKITKKFSIIANKINYPRVCKIVIFFSVFLVFIISGPIGLLILLTATSLGVITQILNIPRQHLMGCLIFPMIIFFVL